MFRDHDVLCELYFQPCNEKLFQFVKENLLIIAGVSIGIAVILVSLIPFLF